MRSIKRNMRLITLMLSLFCVVLIILVAKLYKEASFYIVHSDNAMLGKVYDRNGEVLFDQKASADVYGYDYFTDVTNFIGNDDGQMTNTLVASNLELLNNYSFSVRAHNSEGKSAIYSTLNHKANRAVYDAFGGKNGTAIAYNYKTGEILVCVSKPGLNPFGGYTDLEDGSMLCKAFFKFTPGSTQKVSTLIAAHEIMGTDLISSKVFECTGSYINKSGKEIFCHNLYGHGTQDIVSAFENSCNPYFAQLVEDSDFNLESVIKIFKKMGYSVNESEPYELLINGIDVETASTNLNDKNEFSTQWGCIGQGDTMISPCMMMMWQSAIATETGKATVPYFIGHTTRFDGSADNYAINSYTDKLFEEQTASYVKNVMIQNGQRYTDTIPEYTLGLKSGTAQIKNGAEENSFLTGFDTNPDHPIAFCVLIENRVSGDITTDSIVRTLLSSIN